MELFPKLNLAFFILQGGLSKGAITGLVFMGFFIGFIIGCCLTCYCFKRNRDGGGGDFTYRRINADQPEDAEY